MSTLQNINQNDLITSSRANINDNFAALNTDKMETSVLDTDTTLAANSDAKVATQRAVKAYVDAGGNPDIAAAQAGGSDFGTPSASNKFVTEEKLEVESNRVRKIATDTSVSEIADNSTTETAIWTTTLTGGLLGTNNAVRFKTYISNITGDSNTAVDPVFRLKYGATTVATFTLQQGSDTNALSGYIEGVLMAAGTTFSQRGTLYMFAHEEVLALSTNTATPDVVNVVATGTATEASTGDLTLQLTIQWGNAQANNDFVPAGTVIELIT